MQLFLLLLITGMGTLTSCLFHQYHFVNRRMSWSEAQRYCRARHTDLATVDNAEEMNRLRETVDGHATVWIGLYDDVRKWTWSRDNDTQVLYTNWGPTQPDFHGAKENCVSIDRTGYWTDRGCSKTACPACYDALTKRITVSRHSLTWAKAWTYCRQMDSDLASVMSSEQNQEIQDHLQKQQKAWIGLRRTPWAWSDRSQSSFRHWAKSQPDNQNNKEHCVLVSFDRGAALWYDNDCSTEEKFVCYSVLSERKQTRLKMRISTTADVSSPHVQNQILLQLRQVMMMKQGRSDLTLRWIQRDGRVFHKDENEEGKKGEECKAL